MSRKMIILDFTNKILHGHVLDILRQMPSESVNCVVTSPPYWALRNYGNSTKTIWDAKEGCEHDFKIVGAFCLKCPAWKGQLGLETIFELYIKHLCDIFDEIKRVLRKDGTCFVNLGDSYGGSGNRSGHTEETSNLNRLTSGYGA